MDVYVSSKVLARKSAVAFSPTAIISIVSPDEEHPKFDDIVGDIPILRLKFHDITFQVDFNHNYVLPSVEDVKKIIEFSEKNLKEDSRLLTHCFAGISRSSAAAIIAASTVMGYEGAIRKISNLEIFPDSDFSHKFPEVGFEWFVPNNLMIEHFGEIVCEKDKIIKLMNKSFIY